MPAYCQRCILPDTRPGVRLDAQGVCQGCRYAERKKELDWAAREGAFEALVADVKARRARYDCVIGVSGGKDSFWQVVTCLEHGLRPLCVTYVYPGQNEHGRRNLAQLVELGVDHQAFRVDPHIERSFVAKAFRRVGISGLVTHMAIFSIPVQVAVAYGIPLVVYGENAAFEFGTEDESLAGARMDARWRQAFGVSAGTTVEDWVDDELTPERLAPFAVPSEEAIARSGVDVIFLGYFFRWDPETSRRIAMAHGFSALADGPRVGHYDFVNIDDDMIGVHHHPKWHKFGITRTWDTLSMEIRSGRLSRDEAIDELRRRGDETPWADIERFCGYVGISRGEYFETLERFRNRDIWTRRHGRWVIDGFLVDDFPWPDDPAV